MKKTLRNGATTTRRPPPFAVNAKKAALKVRRKGMKLNGAPVSRTQRMTVQEQPEAAAKMSSVSKHKFRMDKELLLKTYDLMVRARLLEERMIKMYKQSEGYFWLGGPGEEAFNVPLGLNVKKGQGLDYDFLHLHYRSNAIALTMGLEPLDFIRQMKNTASDPFSGGRNFCSHISRRSLNIVPITSTIETQYSTAIGSGLAQKRHGGDSITIVNGGDAGTAEGDFASCLIWATRPKKELPMLIIVTNNKWGISTAADTQHGERHVSDRGKAFGMKTMLINGNDVEESYFAIREAMEYIRKERKPVLLEARVSRLYGHSSATGANFVTGEEDCLATFEKQLESSGFLTRAAMNELREKYNQEFMEMSKRVKEEPMPDPSTIYDHTFFGQKGKYW